MSAKEWPKESKGRGDTCSNILIHDLTLDSNEESSSDEQKIRDVDKDKNQDWQERSEMSKGTGKASRSPPLEKRACKSKLSRNKKSAKHETKTSAFQKIFDDAVSLDQTDDFSGGCTPYKAVIERQSRRNTKTNQAKSTKRSSPIRFKAREQVEKKKSEVILSRDDIPDGQTEGCSSSAEDRGDQGTLLQVDRAASNPAHHSEDTEEEPLPSSAGGSISGRRGTPDQEVSVKASEFCSQCRTCFEAGGGLKHLQECLRARYQRVSSAPLSAEPRTTSRQAQGDEPKASSKHVSVTGEAETSEKMDSILCQLCQTDLSDLEVDARLQHVNSCLDHDMTGAAQPSEHVKQIDQESPSKSSACCQICRRDFGNLNSYRRLDHVNHCIDKAQEAARKKQNKEATIEQARNKVLDCPICGQPLKTQTARKTHLKRCAQKFGVPAATLLKRVKEQEEEYKVKLAAGLILMEDRPCSKRPGRGRTRKKVTASLPRQGQIDNDTRLALALSTSFLEEERRRKQLLNPEEGDLTNPRSESSNTNAFSILMTPKPSKPVKKRGKKMRDEHVPLLLLRSSEEVHQHIADRLAAMLEQQTSQEMMPTPPFRSSRLPQVGNTDRYVLWLQDKAFWRMTSLEGGKCFPKPDPADTSPSCNNDSGKRGELDFYVSQLMPPISPCKVKAGSKLRQMSSIPGYTEEHGGAGDSNKQVIRTPRDPVEKEPLPGSANATLVASTQTAVYLAELAGDNGNLDNTGLLNITMAATKASQDVTVSDSGCTATSVIDGEPLSTCGEPLSTGGEPLSTGGEQLERNGASCTAQGFLTPERPLKSSMPQSVSKVIKNLTSMVDNPALSDLCIKTRDDVLRAHKFMLAARCPHLLEDLGDKSLVELPSFDGDAVRTVLHYIYSGFLQVPCAELHQVAVLASRWSLEELREECCRLMEDQDQMDPSAPRSSSSCADATLNDLLHQMWGSDYDDTDSDTQDEREQNDNKEDLESVYEYMATQRQKQRAEEKSLSSGEDEATDGRGREIEVLTRSRRTSGCRQSRGGSDLDLPHLDILTQLASLGDSAGSDGEEGQAAHVAEEAATMTEETSDESSVDHDVILLTPDSKDKHHEDDVTMETVSPLVTRYVPHGTRPLSQTDCASSELCQYTSLLAPQFTKTQDESVPDQEQKQINEKRPRKFSQTSMHTDDVMNPNPCCLTTPSTVKGGKDRDYVVPDVTPDLFLTSPLVHSSPDFHNNANLASPVSRRMDRSQTIKAIRHTDYDHKSPKEKPTKYQSPKDDNKNSPRVSQRSKCSQVESSGCELFDLSALEDSVCKGSEVEGSPSGNTDNEANNDADHRKDKSGYHGDSSVSNTPSPVFHSKQPQPIRSSQVIANLSNVFSAADSFSISPSSQVVTMAMLTDVDGEELESQAPKKYMDFLTPSPARKRKRSRGSQSDVEVVSLCGAQVKKRTKYNPERIGEAPSHDLTSPYKPPNKPRSKSKTTNPTDYPYKESVPEVRSRSPKGQTDVTTRCDDNAATRGEIHNLSELSYGSDLDPIDLTQDDDLEAVCSTPVKGTGQRSRDSCADENVWSDFDDAGFMEDFGTARLSQQPPTNSQCSRSDSKKQQPSLNLDTIREVPPEDYDPPTDMDTDISMVADDSAVWQPKKVPKQLIVTPKPHGKKKKSRNNLELPSPFTPMAKYDAMDTPELKQNCQKFGLRPVPKKKMLLTLKNIYQETHRYETDSEFDESLTTSKGEAKSSTRLGNTARGGRVAEISGSQGSSVDEELSGSEFMRLPPDGSEELGDGVAGSQPDTEAPGTSKTGGKDKAAQLKAKWEKIRNYILENKDLYLTILQYEPLEFDEFHRDLKDAGILAGSDVVADFLDDQNIQFTTRKRKEGDEGKPAGSRGNVGRRGRGRPSQR